MKTWKIADIGLFFKNSIQAILKGEFLLRLNIGRYFVHIAYTFLLFGLVIWFSLMIETTMSKVEKNKAVLKELEIVHSQKVFELVGVSRRSSVEQMLGEMGSKVKEGLFFAGEVMDIDGVSGGYNLQFAWESGRAAGLAAAEFAKG